MLRFLTVREWLVLVKPGLLMKIIKSNPSLESIYNDLSHYANIDAEMEIFYLLREKLNNGTLTWNPNDERRENKIN